MSSRAVAQSYTYIDEPYLPTASNYGGVGLLDMRNARFMPDGELWLAASVKMPDDRVALSFQALPWLEATFRYTINYALPPEGQRALYDRSFDLKFRLFQEGAYLPQIAVGFQDVIGTGVYSAEYLVASKEWGPLDFTAGLGWGRLASRSAFSNPLCEITAKFCYRPDFSGEGGSPTLDYFRGPNVGLFGGIEYRTPIPRLTFKVEYSSDDYTEESQRQHRNYAPLPVNAGLSYRFWSNVDVGLAYMYGRQLEANLSIALNPEEPNWPHRIDEMPPFTSRTDEASLSGHTENQITAAGPSPDPHVIGFTEPPAPAPQRDAAPAPPLTNVPRIANEPGEEPWRVHFVDLTAPPPPTDSRPPDPSMLHAASYATPNAGSLFRGTGLKVTDDWVDGRTLVVQVAADSRSPSDSICAKLTGSEKALFGVTEVAFVGSDWNPIKFCESGAQPQMERVADRVGILLTTSPDEIVRKMRNAVEAQHLTVDGIAIRGNIVEVEIENDRYYRDTEAISRTVRALSAVAPQNIELFRITTSVDQMPLTTVTMTRTEIDALGQGSTTPAEIWVDSVFADASPSTDLGGGRGFPRVTWAAFPTIQEDLFDPNNPAYIGIGASVSTHLEILPGLALDDEGTYSIWNDFNTITRPADSELPHVRSDTPLYLKDGATGINDLMLSYYMKLAPELYSRVSVGYLENMYGGAGGEILYRPFGSRWAVGVDGWEVYQRKFDDLFGFLPYHVATGHVSVYWETPWYGITAIVRGGRYLAGDYGGTFELDRRFDSGIEIGGWFTLTNVPFSEFGEGSFDKGIRIVIPTEWIVPFATNTSYTLNLDPLTRDGGQRLDGDTTLYNATQSSSEGDLQRQWPSLFK